VIITDDVTYSFALGYKPERILELDGLILEIAVLLDRVEQLLGTSFEGFFHLLLQAWDSVRQPVIGCTG